MVLGVSFTVRVNFQLAFLGNVVRRAGTEGAAYLPFTLLPLTAPAISPLAPVPVITTQTTVGPCDGLTLSTAASTNNGGLAFIYVWSVTGNTSQTTAFATYLNDTFGEYNAGAVFRATKSPMYAPLLTLTPAVLASIVGDGQTSTFTLNLTTWYGTSQQTSVSVTRAAAPLPQIAIAGSKSVATLPPRNVLVNALISRVGVCDTTTVRANITYTWEQVFVPADSNITVEATGDLASLRIRAYAMKARAEPYQFKVSVFDNANGNEYNNSDIVYVTVSASPLRASLTGGDRVHTTQLPLTLSAAASRDPDVNPATDAPSAGLTFVWTCVNNLTPTELCFGVNTAMLLANLTSATPSVLTVPAERLTFNVPEGMTSLRFSVTVGKEAGRPTVSAVTVVTLVPIRPQYALAVAPPDRAQLLQQNPVVLTAYVSRVDIGPSTAANETRKPIAFWSCDTRNANLDEPGLVLHRGAAPASDGSGRMVHTLTLAGEKLLPGVVYTMRLSLFNSTDSALVPTQTEIQDLPVGALPGELVSGFTSFHLNTPPRSGLCTAAFTDTNAVAAVSNTPFMLQCSGWEDDAEDLPLTYHWYAESKRILRGESKSTWVEIGMALPLSTLNATLRAGHEEDDYARVVAVYITDIWGAQTRVEVTVPFDAPPASAMWRTYPSLYSALDNAGSGTDATQIEALFGLLNASTELSDVAAVTQTVLRITDALDTARITAAENIAFRTRLLAAVRGVAKMLTVSQDARRATAALDDAANSTPGSSNGTEPTADDTNLFNRGSGYSEVAIELLTQLCADGTHLDSDARTQAMQFLIAQTSSLASLDAFNGMQASTADSALVATQMLIDAFASELSALNHNMTLTNATADTNSEGARMVTLKNEATNVVNAIAQQMNVLAMGSLSQQAVGQDAPTTVKFAGLSVASQAFVTAQAPSSMEAPMPNTAAGTGAESVMARVTMPPSMQSLNASALQVVMAMIEDSAIFNLAGMGADTYLNGSQSSPLLAFTVFNRTLASVTNVTVADGLTVPVQQPLSFDLASGGAYISSGSPFAILAAAESEFFTLEVPHPKPTWPDVNFVCEWWDANADGVGGKWSTTGCKLASVSSTNTTTTCQCTHLTLFRVRLDFNNFLPRFNTLSAGDFKNLTWANIQAHPLPLITCAVWFVAYLIFAFIAALIDRRKDARALRHYHGEWSDPQRKQWDAVSGDTSASLPSSAVLNPDAGVEKMAFTERWIDFSRHLLKHDHLWLSVVLRYDTNAFSSVGRITAGFVLVLTGYMINALFFGSADGSVGFSTIVTSVISAAILIPVGVLISLLFGRSQQGRLKSAIYGYAEHVAQLQYTNRISEPQYATRNEHRMKRNPVISDEDERVLLHSIAQAGGWTHGPGNALIPENARGVRDERELRNQLRLLVHIDYDLFMVWFRESWSFPLGLRLFGFVLLWIYVIVLALLIIVYGIQLDRNNSDNTKQWLQASAISNVIEIFAMKPVSICVKAFVLLIISFCFCNGKPKGPASKSTPDDNLTVYNAIEMFASSGAGRGHKHVANDLALDVAPERDADPAIAVVSTGFVAAHGDYDDNYAALQNSSSSFNGNSGNRNGAVPNAVEMTPLGGAAKYARVHSAPSSPVVTVPPRFTGSALPAVPYAGNDDYHDYNETNDDWNETHDPEIAPVSPASVAVATAVAALPAAVAAVPPPPPPPSLTHNASAGSTAQPARLVVPPPPLSALHTAQRGQIETQALGQVPAVPAVPAPSGGVPVMGTRSALAYQQREASASLSTGNYRESAAGSTASAQTSLRTPMPLPSHIRPEYHSPDEQ